MLSVFHSGEGHIISNDDYYVRQLASGLDEVVFNVSIRDPIYEYINEEAVIKDRDENIYIIKQIDAGETSAKVVAQIDIDDWKAAMYMDYSNESVTVLNTVLGILPTGWSVIDRSQKTIRRTIPTSDTTSDYNVTAWEILEDCCDVYSVRFRFDVKNKIVYIINPDLYTSRGAFATRDLNLKKLNYKGKSDSFVTRLYAMGADGLTFASINDGKAYVDNQSYAQKVVSFFWKDDRYTVAENLLEDAQKKLAEMAVPTRSYDCDVLDLANTNPDMYGFEDFSLFEVVTLIDDAKEVRTDYQVVERWTYPYYPAKNKIVLSTSTPNIQKLVTNIVNSIESSTSSFQQIIQSAIANSTALITGNHGGYVVFHDSDGDGTPDEILIMDTNDIATATKVWRWNAAGLGYSNTGYNGTYGTAITMDGTIVGDYIAANTINGGSIRAGTIEAEALSASAKEEIAAVHNYISENIFNDISVWEYGTVAPTYETIDGKTYIVLDGTGINAFDTNYYIRIPTDARGDINFNVHFKYHIDRQVVLADRQRFPFVNYTNTSGSGYTTWKWLPAQTIPADTDFEWNVNFAISNVDTSKGTKFGLYFIPGCKIYLEELTVQSTVDTYAEAGMDFNAKELRVAYTELAEVHYLIPYDANSNTDRWEWDWPEYVTASATTVTSGGTTYDAIEFDMTNLSGHYPEYRLITDLMGSVGEVTYNFRMQVDRSITLSNALTLKIRYIENGYPNVMSYQFAQFSAGTTLNANTEYSLNGTFNFNLDADYEQMKPQLVVEFFSTSDFDGAVVKVYDVQLQCQGNNYRKAQMTFSADGMATTVQAGSVISSINQSAEQVSISASKINLTGDLNLRGNFTSYDSGYDPTDPTTHTYAFLDAGNFKFYNENSNVFTIACTPLLGQRAGIFFGDLEDSAALMAHTHIDDTEGAFPWLYNRHSGDYEGRLGMTDTAYSVVGVVIECSTEFYGNVYLRSDEANSQLSVSMPARFYGNVYNQNSGVVFVSDKRKKRNIKDLVIEKARSFIMALKPRKYKFAKDLSTSDRLHHGFIAQEVKEAMSEDWGIYCEDKEQDFIGLRYDEFLADMVAVIQDQQKRIEALERRVDDLTNNQS